MIDKRQLGQSELELTPIVYGAWAIGGWAWGGADRKEALLAIQKAIEMGCTSIDTAPVYGFGRSEEIVGEAIRAYPRENLQILTKYGLRWKEDQGKFYFETKDNRGRSVKIHKYAAADSIIRECEESLQRLGTDYIDLYQIHWPDPTTPIEESMEAVSKLTEQGKVRAAGVCNYNAGELKEADKYIDLASDQVPYNMVRREIEEDVVPYCIENNKGILAYSPLQRGLLTGKFEPGQEFNEGDFRADSKFFAPENIRTVNRFLDEISVLAEYKKASLTQVVLRWTLDQPGITHLLVGARNQTQVEDNLGALSIELTREERDRILDKLNRLEIKDS